MEEEDEFGDLYTDVLSSFPSAVAPPPPVDLNIPQNPQPPPPIPIEAPTIPIHDYSNNNKESLNLNLNLNSEGGDLQEEDRNCEEEVLIPGLQPAAGGGGMSMGIGSESSSESDDDLQIVLNDTNPLHNHHHHHQDDDDDDEEALIIVADDAAAAADPSDWGVDDAAAAADPSDPAAKPPNAPLSAPPRPNYPPNAYHSWNSSQFKYVRPGGTPGGQVRPPMNNSPWPGGRGAGGRGDWRPPGIKGGGQPPMHKGGFHPWPPNAPPRGLDFTLPSHKTIFDVDIDNFEDKPWKYPGVDVSDFFNFSLNEENWKDYCKQLEQLRLESTMQSKIRVYESGRPEQEYDPDLPPELVAAAAINDSSAENADNSKTNAALGEPAKGAARARPLLPTGRAIQVETGCGERLPSVDTRPPRVRDSDAVIQIVLQDSVDDESTVNGDTANPENDSGREDEQVDVVDEDGPLDGDQYYDGYPQECDVIKEDVASKRSPVIGSPHTDVHDKKRERSSPERASSDQHSGSKDQCSTENVGSPCEERLSKETALERSPHISSGDSAHDRRSLDYEREDSADSMERKRSPESLSPAPVEDIVDADFSADHKSEKGKEDSDAVGTTDTSKNKRKIHPTDEQKLSCRVEIPATKDIDDEELKTSRSSDTSKATGNSRDHQKWREGIDEEVVQNGRSVHTGDVKRHRGEDGHESRRKEFDGRMETDRSYVSSKGREDYYSHKEWDPYSGNHFHVKPGVGDRRRERDYSEASWQRRDEDPHGRRIRAEDARRPDRGDEMVSRQRRKVREIERSDKDEYLQSRNFLENGSWRSHHVKDAGLRYRDKDDVLKSRHEILDDHHGKRRKDDDYMRRDHVDKLDMSLGLRESSTRGKRERDGVLNQRKRDDQPRVRDNYDDHHAARLKDEIWLQRERAEQQRDRDEWYRAKQSHEENLSRRDREEARAPVRSSRPVEEKVWVGHSQGREEYKGHDKDTGRHGEQLKRRERVEEEISLQHRGSEDVYARGNQIVCEGKRPRQEKSAARNDRAASGSDKQKFNEKKRKDNYKKARESEGHTSGPSKRHQGEKGVANDTADVKGLSDKAVGEQDTSLHNHSREGREGASSDDEQQDSKRGRSKLERWGSHKDRDYNANVKSSSLKMKEKSRNAAASTVVRDEPAKNVEAEDTNKSLATVKESGGGSEGKDADAKPMDDRHLDTVEKLKRRSERFKLPLASEKDPPAVKKIENEPSPSSQNETPVNAEVKQERPPRKRRWVSS